MTKNRYRTTLDCLERKHSETTSFYIPLVLQCSLCPAVPIYICHLSYSGSLSNFEVDVQVCTYRDKRVWKWPCRLPVGECMYHHIHAGTCMWQLHVLICKHVSRCGEQSWTRYIEMLILSHLVQELCGFLTTHRHVTYLTTKWHRSGNSLWWIMDLCHCTFRSWWEVWKKKPAKHRNWVHRIKTIIQAESHLMPVYESWLFMLAEQWGLTSRLYIILLMHHWECKDKATQLQLCSSAPHKRVFVR